MVRVVGSTWHLIAEHDHSGVFHGNILYGYYCKTTIFWLSEFLRRLPGILPGIFGGECEY